MVVQTQVAPDPTPITVKDNKIRNISTDKNTTGGGPYVKIRLMIQSRVGGAIIGKGGRNIMGLRQDYQAKISVPDSPGPERVITIAANENNAMEIIKKILPYIDEGRGRGGGDHELRVLVHQSRSGAVIGKAGNTIKELRAETGARIKLFTESCPASTDRVMMLHGNQDTIVATLTKVNAILKDVEIRGPYEPYDPYNYDPPSAYSYGGFPEGGGARRATRGARAGATSEDTAGGTARTTRDSTEATTAAETTGTLVREVWATEMIAGITVETGATGLTVMVETTILTQGLQLLDTVAMELMGIMRNMVMRGRKLGMKTKGMKAEVMVMKVGEMVMEGAEVDMVVGPPRLTEGIMATPLDMKATGGALVMIHGAMVMIIEPMATPGEAMVMRTHDMELEGTAVVDTLDTEPSPVDTVDPDKLHP